MTYIPEDKVIEIQAAANLIDVIASEIVLEESSRATIKADCPKCLKKRGLEIPKAKNLYKCFSCGFGGNDSVRFLMDLHEWSFPEAMAYLADKYNISIEEPKQVKPKARKKSGTFRDRQIKESGLTKSDILLMARTGPETQTEIERYESGSIIPGSFERADGDDMILHYYGLDKKPLTYLDTRNRTKPYTRVRWQYPSQHKSKDGKEMKYQSPYKSGNHLWLPNKLINLIESGNQIDFFTVSEGEKKADKLMKHDVPTAGISGINNFEIKGDMIRLFEQIIRKGQVKNVIFFLDADWNDIKAKPGDPVDWRSKQFATAVSKFRDFFMAYSKDSLFLEIYFAYHLDGSKKGIDDLLASSAEIAGEIKSDIHDALLDREGKGKHVQLHKITSSTSHQIRQFWDLHSKTAFFEKHKEKLAELKVFKFNNILHRLGEDGKFELDQKLTPYEQYWKEKEVEDKRGNIEIQISFDYVNITHFLRNRGFGRYNLRGQDYIFIHVIDKIVHQVPAHYVKDYVTTFTEDLENKAVLELLYRGSQQYLGEAKLGNMKYYEVNFHAPEAECQYFFFRETYWKITADNIEEFPLTEFPYHIWENKVIDADVKLINEGLFDIVHEDGYYKVKAGDKARKSDIYKFLSHTSDFSWQKKYMLVTEKDGSKRYKKKPVADKLEDEEIQDHHTHLLSKILATGYVLRQYRDRSNMRAIICVDGIESEVGKAEGGTGKSVWSTMFEHLLPTHVIDAKAPNLTNDQFIYDGVDENTALIVFDDCRIGLDFEFFFSQITRGITVNAKGEKRFKMDPIPIIFNTNNIMRGRGNSFERRQYTLAFSDFFNAYRTPSDEFGRLLFYNWDHEQWEIFYNIMARCVQAFIKMGLKISIPDKGITQRKLRQEMGESFLDWADLFFDQMGPHRNNEVEFPYAMEAFFKEYPRERRYLEDKRKFKEKLKNYAEYAGFEYNPQRKNHDDKRIRYSNREYFTIADEDFMKDPLFKIAKIPEI